MTEPRDLQLAAQTSEDDKVVSQPILFTLANLDPNWGSGVDVTIDWGDGSPPLRSDAEKLRQGGASRACLSRHRHRPSDRDRHRRR